MVGEAWQWEGKARQQEQQSDHILIYTQETERENRKQDEVISSQSTPPGTQFLYQCFAY